MDVGPENIEQVFNKTAYIPFLKEFCQDILIICRL